jgi:hypothetical protein
MIEQFVLAWPEAHYIGERLEFEPVSGARCLSVRH